MFGKQLFGLAKQFHVNIRMFSVDMYSWLRATWQMD